MTEPNGGTIRTIAWSEIFPWLGLVRVFRMSIRFRALFFGAAGILLTAIGWSWIAAIFVAPAVDSPATKWLDRYRPCPWEAVVGLVPDKPGLPVAFAPWPRRGLSLRKHELSLRKMGQLPNAARQVGFVCGARLHFREAIAARACIRSVAASNAAGVAGVELSRCGSQFWGHRVFDLVWAVGCGSLGVFRRRHCAVGRRPTGC